MKRRTLFALSLSALTAPALSSAAHAQTIDVSSSTRQAHVWLFGSQGNFHDGSLRRAASPTPSGEWVSELEAELEDPQALPVCRARTYQESQISGDSIVFTLDGRAETAGLHELSIANVHQVHQLHFHLSSPARFDLRAHVGVAGGLGAGAERARLRLAHADGTEVLSLDTAQGRELSALDSGSLRAGDYVFDADLELFAFGTNGLREAASGNCECELVLLPPGAPGTP